MQPTTQLQKDLAATWAQNGYSQEIIDAAIKLLNNQNPESSDEKDEWLVIPDFKFLKCVDAYMNIDYKDTLTEDKRMLQEDIKGKVSFCLWESKGELRWDR